MKKLISNHIVNLSIGIVLLLSHTNCFGQENKHEFSVSASGIFSSINYDLEGDDLKHGNGAGLGIRYSYYLSDSWSIGLGAEYQWYKSVARFDNFSNAYTTTDVENESFEFRYSGVDYKEKQTARYLNIPLTVQFETSDDEVRFYITGGVKAGIAMNADYNAHITALSTSGYYPQYDAELLEPSFMGFGKFNDVSTGKHDLDTKMAWSGTLETGFKQSIGGRGWAYLGMFLDYGFTKMFNSNNKNLIDYPKETPVNLQYNSVVNTSMAKDARLIAYGVKFRIALN